MDVKCQVWHVKLPSWHVPDTETETHSHHSNKYKLHQPDIIAVCKLSFVSVNDCCCGCATLNRNRIHFTIHRLSTQSQCAKRKSLLFEEKFPNRVVLHLKVMLFCWQTGRGGRWTSRHQHHHPSLSPVSRPVWPPASMGPHYGTAGNDFPRPLSFYLDHSLTMHSRLRFMFI